MSIDTDSTAESSRLGAPVKRRWGRRAARLLMGIVAAGAVLSLGSGSSGIASPPLAPISVSVSVSVSASVTGGPSLDVLDPLRYAIRTRYDAGGGCRVERVRSALIGVPTAVDMGGNVLPDALVTLVAVPGIGDGPDVLELVVTKLRLGPMRGLVEVVVTPDTAAPGRVAVGYDGCEAGVPALFSTTATASDARLSLVTVTSDAGPALTVMGSTFDAVGGAPVNPTTVAARFSPVPALLDATVDILGPSSYRATVNTDRPSNVDVAYSDVGVDGRTDATAAIHTFPGHLDLTFNQSEVTYGASAGIDAVDFAVTSIDAFANTTEISATLTDVPEAASFRRTSATGVGFTTTGGAIGSATVDFATWSAGNEPPALAVLDDQYLVADVTVAYTSARVRLFDFSLAEINAGSGTDASVPIVVDVHHRAGPFHLLADVSSERAVRDSDGNVVIIGTARSVEGHVLNMPGEARVTYSPVSQAFTYDGNAEIDELTVDLVASDPFVDIATESHLRLLGMPTGLEGRLDSTARTFTATLEGGSLDLLEIQATSGPDLHVPEGYDGLRLEDHPAFYVAAVRVTGLQSATVGWGGTQSAHVVHDPGPFRVDVHVDDGPSESWIDIVLEAHDLPGDAFVEYASAGFSRTLTYRGSDTIGHLTLDIVRPADPDDPADANEVHAVIDGLPRHMTMAVHSLTREITATTDQTGSIGALAVALCSSVCQPISIPVSGPDEVVVSERRDSSNTVIRLTGLREASLDLGRDDNDPLVVLAEKDSRPIDIHLDTRYYAEVPGLEIARDMTLDIEIRDLPETIDFTYRPADQGIDYFGSGEIGSAEMWLHHPFVPTTDGGVVSPPGWPGPIAGRAFDAHALIEGLPAEVHFTPTVDEASNSFSLHVGPDEDTTIDRVELELLSHPDVLAQMAANPIVVDNGMDGFVLWNYHDAEAPATEPLDDKYAIVVRVTNLHFISYSSVERTDEGQTVEINELGVTLERVSRPDVVNPDLWVEVEQSAFEFATFEVVVDFLYATYTDPPDRLSFHLDAHKGASDVIFFSTGGSDEGGGIHLETSFGPRQSFTDLAFGPIPAGSDDPDNFDPGIWGCLAASSLHCSPFDKGVANEEQLSVSLLMNAPVTIDGSVTTADGKYIVVENVTVEQGLTVSKQKTDHTLPDDITYMYADTAAGTVHGEISVYEEIGGDRDFSIDIPWGFYADGYAAGIGPTAGGIRRVFEQGSVACPPGLYIEHDFGPDLQDAVCPNAKVSSVEHADGSRASVPQGSTRTIHIWGDDFSPTACPVGPYFPGEWPPCDGPPVTTDADPADIVIGPVTWLSVHHLTVEVTVVDASPGSYDICVDNPLGSNLFPSGPSPCLVDAFDVTTAEA